MSARRGGRFASVNITPGAFVVLAIEVALTLVYLMINLEDRASFDAWLSATPASVFEHGHVWTLATSVFLEHDFIQLLIAGFLLWSFIPTLERFWGTPRFYRFFAITSIVGTLTGVGVGWLLGGVYAIPIAGMSPFIYGAIVAFGIVYARQPVQFFGVLPLTGRQLMYGFLGLSLVVTLMTQKWALGAATAAACIAAALMTSKRLSPGLAWRRWRISRARAKLAVIDGGVKPRRPADEQKWLN